MESHPLSCTCAPAQVLTEYSDEQLPLVLEATEKLQAHLTAAVVSNDPIFTQKARRCSCSIVLEVPEGNALHIVRRCYLAKEFTGKGGAAQPGACTDQGVHVIM